MLVPGDPLAHRALDSLLRAEASVRRRLTADLEREGLSASGFSVLVGTETLLLDTLREGAAGCISATVNVTSRLARRVHDAHQAGESDEAEALQRRLTELRALIEAYPMIPALKRLTAELTGDEDWRNLRPPLSALDETDFEELLSRLPLSELL